MIKEKVLPCLPALPVSWLSITCAPGLSDDADLYFRRNSGNIPLSKGWTTEAHIRDTLPRYLNIVEEVAVESDDVLGVSGGDRVDDCTTEDTTDMDIHRIMMAVPVIDYEDLRRMIVEGAQRNDSRYSWDPVRRDKLNFRAVTIGDEYRSKLSLYHHEAGDDIVIDLYSERMFPSQPLDPDTPRWSYPLPSLEEVFPDLTIVQAFNDNGNEDPELRPQSGTWSGG